MRRNVPILDKHLKPGGGREVEGSVEGFTLIELMVVLVIVAVLLAIALPSFSVLTLRTKLRSYTNDIVTSVHLARSEAIKRNREITLCVSNSDGTDCNGSGTWDQGWIVLDDPNDMVIKWQQAAPSDITLKEKDGIHTIKFKSSGLNGTPATFYLCAAKSTAGVKEIQVPVSATGRPRADNDPSSTYCP